MDVVNKVKFFEKELSYINDNVLKEFAKNLVENLPDYFFEVDASSTGKYHPKYAAGNGGLTRHVKAAVKMAVELLENPIICKPYSKHDRDLIIIALLIHDGLKYGSEKIDKYTKFDHPILAADYVKSSALELNIAKEDIDKLYAMISCHMGPWNTNSYSSIILPTPKAPLDKFVHMCDYLASRRFINIEFDSNDNIIDESKEV